MFDSLSDKLANAFKKFKNKGKLSESDVKEGMREINLFGAFKQTWSDVFDQVDIESIGFNKLSTMMFCDLTATILYDDLDKFAREIVSSTRFGNAYIFFDDEKIYNEIIEKIK